MKKKKNPKLNNGRDYLMVEIIKGVTKSGAHKNKKKENDKKKARQKITEND